MSDNKRVSLANRVGLAAVTKKVEEEEPELDDVGQKWAAKEAAELTKLLDGGVDAWDKIESKILEGQRGADFSEWNQMFLDDKEHYSNDDSIDSSSDTDNDPYEKWEKNNKSPLTSPIIQNNNRKKPENINNTSSPSSSSANTTTTAVTTTNNNDNTSTKSIENVVNNLEEKVNNLLMNGGTLQEPNIAKYATELLNMNAKLVETMNEKELIEKTKKLKNEIKVLENNKDPSSQQIIEIKQTELGHIECVQLRHEKSKLDEQVQDMLQAGGNITQPQVARLTERLQKVNSKLTYRTDTPQLKIDQKKLLETIKLLKTKSDPISKQLLVVKNAELSMIDGALLQEEKVELDNEIEKMIKTNQFDENKVKNISKKLKRVNSKLIEKLDTNQLLKTKDRLQQTIDQLKDKQDPTSKKLLAIKQDELGELEKEIKPVLKQQQLQLEKQIQQLITAKDDSNLRRLQKVQNKLRDLRQSAGTLLVDDDINNNNNYNYNNSDDKNSNEDNILLKTTNIVTTDNSKEIEELKQQLKEIETAYNKLNEEHKVIKSSLKDKEDLLESKTNDFNKVVEEKNTALQLKDTVKSLENSKDAAEKALQEKTNEIVSLQVDLKRLKSVQEEVVKLREAKEEISVSKKKLNKQLNNINEQLNVAITERDQLKEDKIRLEKEVLEKSRELTTSEANFIRTRAELEGKILATTSTVDESKSKLQSFLAKEREWELTKTSLEEQVNNLKSTIDELRNKLQSNEQERGKLDRQVQQLQSKLEDESKQRVELENSIAQANSLSEDLREQLRQSKEKEIELKANIENEQQLAVEKVHQLEQSHLEWKAESDSLKGKIQSEIEMWKSRYDELQEQLTETNDSLEIANSKYNDLSMKNSKVEGEKAHVELELQRIRNEHTRIVQQLASVEAEAKILKSATTDSKDQFKTSSGQMQQAFEATIANLKESLQRERDSFNNLVNDYREKQEVLNQEKQDALKNNLDIQDKLREKEKEFEEAKHTLQLKVKELELTNDYIKQELEHLKNRNVTQLKDMESHHKLKVETLEQTLKVKFEMQISALQAKLDSITDRYDDVQRQLVTSKSNETQLRDEMKQQRDIAKEEILKLQQQYEEKKKEMNNIRERLNEEKQLMTDELETVKASFLVMEEKMKQKAEKYDEQEAKLQEITDRSKELAESRGGCRACSSGSCTVM